eukprot:2249125-Rhodomonas_salina.1
MTIANWTDGSRWVSEHIKASKDDKGEFQPFTFDFKFGNRHLAEELKTVTITDVSWVNHELQSWAQKLNFSSFKVEEVKLEYEICGLKEDSLTKARLALKGLSEKLKKKLNDDDCAPALKSSDILKWSISCPPTPVKMDKKLIGSATLVYYTQLEGDHQSGFGRRESEEVKALSKVFNEAVTVLLGSGIGHHVGPDREVVFKPPICKTGTPPTLTVKFEVMHFNSKGEGDAWFEAIKKDAKKLFNVASAAKSSGLMHVGRKAQVSCTSEVKVSCTSEVNSRMEVIAPETGPNEKSLTLLVKASTLLVGNAAWQKKILNLEDEQKTDEREEAEKEAVEAVKAAVTAAKECVKGMFPTNLQDAIQDLQDAIQVDFPSKPE